MRAPSHPIKIIEISNSFDDVEDIRTTVHLSGVVVVAIRKYKNPDDWMVAKRALKETSDL